MTRECLQGIAKSWAHQPRLLLNARIHFKGFYKREKERTAYHHHSRANARAGSSNGVKNSRPLKQKAGGKVTAWIFLPTVKDPHSSVWWPLLNARIQWLGYQPHAFQGKAVHILFNVSVRKNGRIARAKLHGENLTLKITIYDSSGLWRTYQNFYYVFHIWNIIKISGSRNFMCYCYNIVILLHVT